MSFQQRQQKEDESVVVSLSVQALDDAVNLLLNNNFDADSRICIVTLMKLLDNVLIHKPYDPKVRSIRLLNNGAFYEKVGRRRGGIEFLQACGFTVSSTAQNERLLILHSVNEKTSHLVTARRLLQTRAVQDLNMKLEELPVLKTPLPPPVLSSSTASAGTASASAAATASATGTSTSFNVYAGHRYDMQSAAAGTHLGPDANYQSSTEVQLQSLQKQQQALQKKLQQPLATSKDRQWRAWDAASNQTQTILASTAAAAAAALDGTGGTATGGGGDSSLLAARLQKQQRDRQQLEEGGFTTAAMRQVERLKKQKVYSHVQLTIQFADGVKLTGKFVPSETIEAVRHALLHSCFINEAFLDFDLYITPPRRVLQNSKTLEQEGLAPAAKIFCSFKSSPKAPPTPPPSNGTTAIGGRFILRPELFAAHDGTSMTAGDAATPAFPIAQPIVGGDDSKMSSSDATSGGGCDDDDSKPSAKPTKKKVSREDALLNRMMGRK